MLTDLSFMQLNMIVSVVLFGLSLVIPFGVVFSAGPKFKTGDIPELLIVHALFFNVGCLFLTGFMGQVLYGPEIAALLGWSWSPFQYELAFSELGLAVLGLISPLFKKEFWLSTIIASVIWFIGGSVVHLYYLFGLGYEEVLKASFVIGWNIFLSLWLMGLYVLYLVITRRGSDRINQELESQITDL